jgi:hypothetical protein
MPQRHEINSIPEDAQKLCSVLRERSIPLLARAGENYQRRWGACSNGHDERNSRAFAANLAFDNSKAFSLRFSRLKSLREESCKHRWDVRLYP